MQMNDAVDDENNIDGTTENERSDEQGEHDIEPEPTTTSLNQDLSHTET
jgi:hypothetical protein